MCPAAAGVSRSWRGGGVVVETSSPGNATLFVCLTHGGTISFLLPDVAPVTQERRFKETIVYIVVVQKRFHRSKQRSSFKEVIV